VQAASDDSHYQRAAIRLGASVDHEIDLIGAPIAVDVGSGFVCAGGEVERTGASRLS
jgi:hypothetical protein